MFDVATAILGGLATGLLTAAATACAILAFPCRLNPEITRADHHAREGLAAHLPSVTRDFASMRIAGARYLDISWLARKAPTLDEAQDLGAVAGERIGKILGHVAGRVGTLTAGLLLGAPYAGRGVVLGVLGGVWAGYVLDEGAHQIGVRVGRVAGAAYARVTWKRLVGWRRS